MNEANSDSKAEIFYIAFMLLSLICKCVGIVTCLIVLSPLI